MKTSHPVKICGVLLLSLTGYALVAPPAQAASTAADLKTISKEFIIDRPTLISLGFAWKIEGDALPEHHHWRGP